jgi:glycosyltransferase involved in cell wall biosynthesis
MINVVQIVEDLKLGGLERVIENIAMHLDPERFKTYVLCLSRGGEIAERLITNGKDVEILSINNYHNPLNFTKVVNWLNQKKIDIVHTHGYPAGVLGRFAAIFAGIPCIFHHVHSTYLDLNKKHHAIENFLSRSSSKVICCSEAVREFVQEKEKISEDKLTVIYNGIPEPVNNDIKEITELRNSLGFHENTIVVGCVASLNQHKGHRYLLEAFREIDNAALLIIGDGPMAEELKKYSIELGISERTVFAGHKMDVLPFIRLMDIVVLPSSEREGLGISIIEAMALSKPVIVTAIGGLPEVVADGETGIVVEAKNSKALAFAINKLSAAPDLRERMGAKGNERYNKIFSLNDMLIKMENLYEQCNR